MRLLRLLKRDLQNEAREWVRDGLVSPSQAAAICARYGIDYQDRTQRSFGYHVLVALGYLFIGLAVIVLIGENWEAIPRAARMAGLVGLTLMCNGIGLAAWWRGRPKVSVGWFFLGGLMYGASIMLIAQIYHIGEHFPDGVFWWALGVLPVALLLRSNLIMLLSMALAYLWFLVEAGLGFFPVAFPLFLIVLAWQNLFVRHSLILFLMLMGGVGLFVEYALAWVIGDFARFVFGPEHALAGAAIFVVFHGLSKWLGQRPESHLVDYGVALELWTLRFALLGLFVFSFEWSWHELLQPALKAPGLLVLFSLLCIVLGVYLAYRASRSMRQSASTLVFAGVYLAALISVLSLDARHSELLQVADNLVLILTGVGLIMQGIRCGETHFFYLGVFTVLLTGLLRYIDLVGDYIGAALLFAVFAGILLGAARFWKNHVTMKESTS